MSFNDIGEIIKWETKGRHDRFEGRWREVEQIGYRSNYQEISGVKVPLNFEIEKILPDGTHEVFWKGEIKDIQFDILP